MTNIQELEAAKLKIVQLEKDALAANQATADLITAKASIASLTSEISTLKTDLIAANTAKDSAVAAQGVAEKALTDGKAALAVEANKIALGIVAGQGGTVVKIDADTDKSKTMKRADFDKLGYDARNEFIRTGGKLTE